MTRQFEGSALRFAGSAADLASDAGVEAIASDIQTAYIESGEMPSLIVFDTLARCMVGADENSAVAMSDLIARLTRHFIDRYGMTVLLVHHEGLGKGGRARGSSVIRGAVDAEYKVTKSGERIQVSCTKMKECGRPEPILLNLVIHQVDEESTGATIRLCDKSTEPDRKPVPGLGKNQRKALQALQACIEARGDIEGHRTTLDAWRGACGEAGLDRRRFPEARRSLESSEHIRTDGVFVYMNGDGSNQPESTL